ncbi:MAG: RidA family protein [Planctomycetaceae bacterium]|nr:MAG: RidA family protein [Planctomycetaceae bacterium]
MLSTALLAALALGQISSSAAESALESADDQPRVGSIEYVPMDAPPGMAQAVIVQGAPLVHTRQILPRDSAGQLVGEDSLDQQIQQVLTNLTHVLQDCGSGLDHLVRLNIYALAPSTIDRVRELLNEQLSPSVRPTITFVLTPLPLRGAMVAVDAVAMGEDRGDAVVHQRCEAIAGHERDADAAVLPPGGVAYLSGLPEDGGLTESAVVRCMTRLMSTLEHLQLAPEHVVHIKVFLRPVTSADQVLGQIRDFFPDQMTPPVVFVEWLASVPIEIEMIAQLPRDNDADDADDDQTKPPLEFFNPPDVWPSAIFSRVALVRTDRQIYIGSQFAREPSRGQPQAIAVFEQLEQILQRTGSDMRHMAKGTYYVADHDASRWIDRTRPTVFDPERPPAASKAMVHAVGREGRTMTVDMIAVESADR